ncbi:PR domain zinc finger protein 10 [Portunus trituberculatus]|uniref:PR domain zinc finger protein 10 n=1 Tax=Portunus trituberculatus TaxID=210409 RepID=A0A5B7FTV3_PORTR|nr:PR domain zinc finger protein 10 [Portunus trituberculatus]
MLENSEDSREFGVVYKILRKEEECLLLDTLQEELSNWMIFVRPGEKKADQNLVAFQYKGEIYFATIKVSLPMLSLKQHSN